MNDRAARLRILALNELLAVSEEIEAAEERQAILIRAADQAGATAVDIAQCAGWSRGRVLRHLGRKSLA